MKTFHGFAAVALLSATVLVQAEVLSAAQIEAAQWVHVGTMPCELGQSVVLAADPSAMGFFDLKVGRAKYRLSAELTSTGTIRLEDKRAGIVWLQLANKSMLMNQKLGRRIADDCRSNTQQEVADEMRRNPPASLLDQPASGGVVTK